MMTPARKRTQLSKVAVSLCQAKATTGSTKKGLRIPSPGFSPSFVPRRNRFRQRWTANRTHSPSLARNGVLGDQSASGIRLLQTSPDGTSGPEEHTSELQSRSDLVCRLLLEKKKEKDGQALSVHAQR